MKVSHSTGSYEIVFGEASQELSRTGDRNVVVVTDKNLAPYLPKLCLDPCPALIFEPGEPAKSMDSWAHGQRWLAQHGVRRDSLVIALGGGVIGDLGGFIAASYMRGIEYWQVPTTLLAMVDSSVGGKVAVDIPEGKNLVGAFHPPSRVIIDASFLDTLPEREVRAGIAEVVKYGAILDAELFHKLQQPWNLQDKPLSLIQRCIDLKRQVVEADEFERLGIRAKLNFGHTIGHAIEAAAGLGVLRHGEAISIGMVLESHLAERIGFAETGLAEKVRSVLDLQGLPTRIECSLEAEELLELMRTDKKASRTGHRMALCAAIGRCELVSNLSDHDILPVLREGGAA